MHIRCVVIYKDLKELFTEHVIGLLDSKGLFGFYNGLGADRQICYDVYTKVVEMHLTDAGLDIEWNELDVDMKGLEEEGKGEWDGVKRRYWTLDSKLFLIYSSISELTRTRIPASHYHSNGLGKNASIITRELYILIVYLYLAMTALSMSISSIGHIMTAS